MTKFQDPTGLSRWATIMLCAYMALLAIETIRLLIVRPGAPAFGLVVVFYPIALVLCAILILCWVYRASANAHLFGTGGMTITPGWSVGWFFIPIANLVMPFRGVDEAWRASQKAAGRDAEARSPVVRWWWGLWLLNNIVTSIVLVTGGGETYASPGLHFLNLIATALGIAASLVLIRLMSSLNRAQLIASRGSVFA